MKDKITTVKNFSKMEMTGNVTNNLKGIRYINLQVEINTPVYDALDKSKKTRTYILITEATQNTCQNSRVLLKHLITSVEISLQMIR